MAEQDRNYETVTQAFLDAISRDQELAEIAPKTHQSIEILCAQGDLKFAKKMSDKLNDLIKVPFSQAIAIMNKILPGQEAAYQGEEHAESKGLTILILPDYIPHNGTEEDNVFNRFLIGVGITKYLERNFLVISPSRSRKTLRVNDITERRLNLDYPNEVAEAIDILKNVLR